MPPCPPVKKATFSLLSVTEGKAYLYCSHQASVILSPGALLPAPLFVDVDNALSICCGVSFNMASVQGTYLKAREVQRGTLAHNLPPPQPKSPGPDARRRDESVPILTVSLIPNNPLLEFLLLIPVTLTTEPLKSDCLRETCFYCIRKHSQSSIVLEAEISSG